MHNNNSQFKTTYYRNPTRTHNRNTTNISIFAAMPEQTVKISPGWSLKASNVGTHQISEPGASTEKICPWVII